MEQFRSLLFRDACEKEMLVIFLYYWYSCDFLEMFIYN